MRLSVLGLATVLMTASAPVVANAGVYGDDLGKCLVKATSVEDRATFMAWLYGVMSLNPAVHDLSKITPAQLDETDHKVADLFGRLIFKDCRSEAVDAIKYEGVASFQSSFELFGKVAMTGLLEEPHVSAGVSAFAKDIDMGEMKKLVTEAGVKAADK
jgi:hypothetical protein